jgi:hypothetical protein
MKLIFTRVPHILIGKYHGDFFFHNYHMEIVIMYNVKKIRF